MYLLITSTKSKSGKIYRSAKVAESYKTHEGKSRQKIIFTFGPVKSQKDEDKFREIVKRMKKGREFIDINSMKFISSKSYGIYSAVSQLFEKYGMDKVLRSSLKKGRHQFDAYAIIKALIVNRLENPLSKNKAFDYIQKEYPEEIPCIKDNLYSAMDVLEDQKETIELDIFSNLKDKLNLNLEEVHYDITSSYFEGHKCKIAMYGYSRDHRPDREQIIIGLVLVDNVPVYHEVFKGNTSDKITVLDVVNYLKERFGLEKPIIVGDRGMFTQDNIEKLENDKENYVFGFSKTGNKITEEVIVQKISLPKGDDACNASLAKEEVVEYSQENIQIRKYILCIDKNTQKEQIETLENVKKFIQTQLTDLKEKYEKSMKSKKGKKMTWESVTSQIKKITSRNKRLFDIIYDHKKQHFDFEIEQKWYEREQKAAGKFVLVTNTDKTPLEVLKTYKALNTVESSFNCIKNQLDLRPVNHYKTERVKAHVFICVLALLVEKIMDKSLQKISAQSALEELRRIKIGEFKIGNIVKNDLTEISFKQKEIFSQLKLIFPII